MWSFLSPPRASSFAKARKKVFTNTRSAPFLTSARTLPLIFPFLLTFPCRRRGVNVRNRFASPHFSEFIFALHGAFELRWTDAGGGWNECSQRGMKPDCMMNKRKGFSYELMIICEEARRARRKHWLGLVHEFGDFDGWEEFWEGRDFWMAPGRSNSLGLSRTWSKSFRQVKSLRRLA